jgi:hypothetical protein
MKDSIVLQGRTYECTKLVQQRFGLDDQTLRKWVKNKIVLSPLRLGNKCFYDREAIESKILSTCRRLIALSQVRQHLGLAGEI